MRKIQLIIFLLFLFKFGFSHNPQVSSLSFIQNENKKWSVFITAPLYTCQLAINANYPNLNIDSLDVFAMQRVIIDLIKNNLRINGKKNSNLTDAKIQIAHETTMYFEIADTLSISEIEFTPFSRLGDHFSILRIVPKKDKEINFVLNSDNRYAYISDSKMESLGELSLNKYIDIISGIGTRYTLIAGCTFFFFYRIFKRKLLYKKIQSNFPKFSDYFREIFFSTTSILIFGFLVLYVMHNPNVRPHTKIYDDIHERSWLYYFSIFPVMVIIHDTYFYWTHRLMHHKRIFPVFHLVHHKSTNPSPWAAYAFHPLEAIVENGIFILMVFSFPLHKTHTPIFFLFSIMYNIYGHLGWELFPKGFNKTLIGKWLNTSVAHNQHHKYFKGNYGLYFLFWDRMMGTLRKDYDMAYEEIKNR